MSNTQTRESDGGVAATIDPCADGIRAHACIKHIPQWPDNGPRMEALRRDLQATGLCQPVQMTAKHEIVDADSRERWRAARMLQMACIPVAIVPEEQVFSASISALVHRRHHTKSALAYLVWPMLKTALEESRFRRHENIKKGQCFPDSALSALSGNAEELAEHYGIARHFIFDAKKVHELFAKDHAYKAQMEPRLLAEPIGGEHEQHRPVGLGAVIAGYAGKRNEDGIAKKGQLELFTGGFETLFKRFMYWTGFDPSARRKALEKIRADMDKLPPEQCDDLADMLRTIAKEASQRGKETAK